MYSSTTVCTPSLEAYDRAAGSVQVAMATSLPLLQGAPIIVVARESLFSPSSFLFHLFLLLLLVRLEREGLVIQIMYHVADSPPSVRQSRHVELALVHIQP